MMVDVIKVVIVLVLMEVVVMRWLCWWDRCCCRCGGGTCGGGYEGGGRHNVGCAVGWSDLALFFRFLKTYTLLLIRYIFRNSISKNRHILAVRAHCTRVKVFIFKKLKVP